MLMIDDFSMYVFYDDDKKFHDVFLCYNLSKYGKMHIEFGCLCEKTYAHRDEKIKSTMTLTKRWCCDAIFLIGANRVKDMLSDKEREIDTRHLKKILGDSNYERFMDEQDVEEFDDLYDEMPESAQIKSEALNELYTVVAEYVVTGMEKFDSDYNDYLYISSVTKKHLLKVGFICKEEEE